MNLTAQLIRGFTSPAIAQVYEPRGHFDPPVFIVADVRAKYLRLHRTPSKSEAFTIRDAWRRENFAVPGETRAFAADQAGAVAAQP